MPEQFYPMSHADAQALIEALEALNPGPAGSARAGLMGPAQYLSNGLILLANSQTAGLESPAHFNLLENLDNIVFHDGPLTRSAAYHNAAPKRGKNLGSAITAAQWAAIYNGTFDGLWLGDFWTINGIKITIVDFDPNINVGDTALTRHHLGVQLVKDWSSQWYTGNDTSMGYVGSTVRSYIKSTVEPQIISAIGNDHVLSYRALYPSAYSNGEATGWAWVDAKVELFDEMEVYGSRIWGSSAYECGHSSRQMSLFRIDTSAKYARATWWLRSVSSAAGAAHVGGDGGATGWNASGSNAVRPLSLIG